MASGRRHETVNLLALGGLTVIWYWGRLGGEPLIAESIAPLPARVAFVVSYLLGTFLVTPDLDLANRSVRAKSNWGVFGVLWLPYGAVFKHRGLSHTWIAGPLTRLLYMLVLFLALTELTQVSAGWLGYDLSLRAGLQGEWGWLAGGGAAGYFLSQWLHLLLDGFPARSRRRLR